MRGFDGLRAPASAWVVVRVDGRGFSRLTAASFEKPFDRRFHEAMLAAAEALLRELAGRHVHTHSDEASVVVAPGRTPFGGRLEKLVSLAAAAASVAFARAAGLAATFDGRLLVADSLTEVVEHLLERQRDAGRAALQGLCYWRLRRDGLDAAAATAALRALPGREQRALLVARGVDVAALPAWQVRGVDLHDEEVAHVGVDPRTGAVCPATRRRLRVVDPLPAGPAYAAYLRARLGAEPGGGA